MIQTAVIRTRLLNGREILQETAWDCSDFTKISMDLNGEFDLMYSGSY